MGHTRNCAVRSALARLLTWTAIGLVAAPLAVAQDEGEYELSRQKQVAELVRERVLDGDFGERTLWMTERPLDQSFVVRDLIADRSPDREFPFAATWLVMIDEMPDANFAHPVRWLFVDAATGELSEVVKSDFPPLVVSEKGAGRSVDFRCVPVTPKACPQLAIDISDLELRPFDDGEDCLHAVLVSGGISPGANYDRYRQNLRSMYQILRAAGYPRANIYVYYADGSSLDLDNADGDNNDATGGDITGGADENAIRARIQDLCANSDPDVDVLFTYFSNHGADDSGVCLWDGDSNGLGASELYSPAELAADTANCQVCRHFMIHDQCFAGDFLPMASDGDHGNLAVYAAASATEPSWGRQYLAQWEQNDATTTTVNDMHQDVADNGALSSTPGMAEGTAGVGDNLLSDCCPGYVRWPWIVVAVIAIIVIIWWVRRSGVGGAPA